MKMSNTAALTAGIDTAKSTLDMAIHGRSAVVHVPNTTSGWKQLAETLEAAGIKRVGIEATLQAVRGKGTGSHRQGPVKARDQEPDIHAQPHAPCGWVWTTGSRDLESADFENS